MQKAFSHHLNGTTNGQQICIIDYPTNDNTLDYLRVKIYGHVAFTTQTGVMLIPSVIQEVLHGLTYGVRKIIKIFEITHWTI